MSASLSVRLEDKVTSAAKRMDGALDKVEDAMDRTAGSARRMGQATDRAGDDVGNTSRALDRSNSSFGRAGSSAGGFAGQMTGVRAAVLAAVAALALLAARAVAALGAAVVQMAAFADATKRGLGVLLRDGPKGAKLFNEVAREAASLGLNVQEATKQFQKLIAAKFDVKQAKELIKMQAVMKGLGTTADEASRAMMAIVQIKAKGRLQTEELLQLNEAGITLNSVLKALEKRLGKSRKEVQKLLETGKVTAEDGILAIQDAVKNLAGSKSLDEAARKLTNSLGGAWDKIKAQAQLALLDIAQRSTPALTEMANAAKDAFAEFAGSQAGQDLKSGIVGAVKSVAQVIKAAIPAVKAFVTGIIEGAGMASAGGKSFTSFGEAIAAIVSNDAFISFMKGAGRVIGAVVTVMTQIVMWGGFLAGILANLSNPIAQINIAFGILVGEIENVWASIKSFASGLFGTGASMASNLASGVVSGVSGMISSTASAAQSLGASITDGIAAGIMSAPGKVMGAVSSLVRGAISRGAAILDSSSPSKVFMNLGSGVGEGFALGMEGEQGRVQGAMEATVNPRQVAAAIGGMSGGTSVSAPVNANIHVNAPNADAAEVAAQTRAQFLSDVGGAIEQLHIQVTGG